MRSDLAHISVRADEDRPGGYRRTALDIGLPWEAWAGSVKDLVNLTPSEGDVLIANPPMSVNNREELQDSGGHTSVDRNKDRRQKDDARCIRTRSHPKVGSVIDNLLLSTDL